jgi:DNA-binding CsgD family transcriptional regulator
MPETDYRELERKATLQHYLTVLARSLDGDSPEQIALSLGWSEASVRRDLEFARGKWSTARTSNGDAHTKRGISQTLGEDQLERTTCALCNEAIHAGEYRVVLLAVEIGHRNSGGGNGYVSGRGRSFSSSYCDVCVAEMPHFEFLNWWKLRSDADATPSAGPATEDAAFRSVSVQGIAEKASADMDGTGDGDSLGEADIQANVLSSESPTRPGPELAGEAAQRARLASFLKAPTSRGMRSDMRTAAKMWVEGASQNEVARKLGKDQSTVSRMIAGARKMAYARG